MKIETYLSEDPVFAVISAGKTLSSSIKDNLSKYDLNYYESLVLASLTFEDTEHIRAEQMSNTFQMSKGNLSQLISKLESKGYLKRIPQKNDKRRYTLALSNKGKKTAIELVSFYEKLSRRMEKQLDNKKIKNFISELISIKNNSQVH